MCPFKPCTAEMMASGDCLTFIQAVAIQVHASAGSSGHMVIMRNNSLRVDYEDRHPAHASCPPPLAAHRTLPLVQCPSPNAPRPKHQRANAHKAPPPQP